MITYKHSTSCSGSPERSMARDLSFLARCMRVSAPGLAERQCRFVLAALRAKWGDGPWATRAIALALRPPQGRT